MSDECDLEELTAFLEASDSEDDDAKQPEDEGLKKASKGSDNGDDECDLNEIEAFLQASDDEEDDDVGEDICVTKGTDQDDNSPNMDPEFEDMDAGDFEEWEDMMESEDNDVKSQPGTSTMHNVSLEAADSQPIEGSQSNEENQAVDVSQSASSSQAGEIVSNLEEPSDNSGKEDVWDKGDRSAEDDDIKESDIKDEGDFDGIIEGDEVDFSGEDEAAAGQNAESDIDEDSKKAIEAEMLAMAKRMEELKQMLKKSKSSPPSCKKPSKTSPRTESKSGTDAASSPATCKTKLQTSPYSSKTPSKNTDGPKLKFPSGNTKLHSTPSASQTSSKLLSGMKSSPASKSSSMAGDAECRTSKVTSKTPSKSSSIHLETKHELVQKSKDSVSLKQKVPGQDKQHSRSATGRTTKHTITTKVKTEPNSCKKTKDEEAGADENPFFAGTEIDGPVDSKTLFGDSDDSDWDDLAGEEKSQLSEQGKEIKKLITSGTRTREAHMPNYDPAVLKKPNISRWTDSSSQSPVRHQPVQKVQQQKPALNPETGTVSGKYRVKDEYMQKPTAFMNDKDDREHVTDPFCGIRIVNPRISMDVFKRKMDGRNMMKISRLLSKAGTCDLQKDNWVTLGVVVHKTEPRQSAAGKSYCIWKLSDLQNCDKTVAFFLFGNVYKDHWKNDLGIVIGLLNPSVMDKAEKNQSEVAITINHPQQLLVMGISKDLGRCRSTTKSGQPCSSFINKMQGEYCTYHVQSAYRKSSSKRTELQASTGVAPKAFTQQKKSSQGCFFYGGQTFTTQKTQAKNSKDFVTLKKLQTLEAGKARGKITTMSLHELEPEDEKKLEKLREKDKELLNLLAVPTAGSMNFVKHLVKKDAIPSGKTDGDGNVIIQSASAKDLLKEHARNIQQRKRQVDLLSATPTLGKGFSTGQEISLDVPVKKGTGCASAELAKQLAIAKVKAKGGLNKEDPNAVRKKLTSPEAREKIKKRVAGDMDTDGDGGSAGGEESKAPPPKRSKLLGDLDLNSPEVQQLLKKKSKHTGALAEAEAEHEERYFGALEKREQMEEKMGAIMEVSVKVFCCIQCKYRYFSVHERCKKENHTIKTVQGTKRFFKCKQCKKRTVSLDKLPTKPCKECGNTNFERVSMLKERSGPKLESEELCLRGNEQKFIGSLQGKVSFNG